MKVGSIHKNDEDIKCCEKKCIRKLKWEIFIKKKRIGPRWGYKWYVKKVGNGIQFTSSAKDQCSKNMY